MSKFVEKSYLYDFYGFLSSITGIQSSILKKLQQASCQIESLAPSADPRIDFL